MRHFLILLFTLSPSSYAFVDVGTAIQVASIGATVMSGGTALPLMAGSSSGGILSIASGVLSQSEDLSFAIQDLIFEVDEDSQIAKSGQRILDAQNRAKEAILDAEMNQDDVDFMMTPLLAVSAN
jgi:hypothetical protein